MNYLDLEELAQYLTGCEEEEEELDEAFHKKYGIDLDTAFKLVNDLLPLCNTGQSPLTEKWYRGFGTSDTWLIKQEVILKRKGS